MFEFYQKPIGVIAILCGTMATSMLSAADLSSDLHLDVVCRFSSPVISGDAPHDRLQSHIAHQLQGTWPAPAEGRTEQTGVLADGVCQRLLALLNFQPRLPRRGKDQVGMVERMIPNRVPSLR